MSTGTLASSATCGNGAPDLVDVGEHCDQDQVFDEADLAGTVFSITEGAGVYVPNIGHILPVQGDTTYTVRMVITPESTSGWNRIPNVNHGADHGLYINGGTQIYPDGQGGADNYPAGEWSSLTVVTDTGGPMPTPITMVNSRAVGSRSIIGRRQCKSPLTRCSFSMTTTKNTVTLVASTRTFCSSRSKYSF